MSIIFNLLIRNGLFIVLLFTNANLLAQVHFKLSGVISDDDGKPLNGATIFLSGSEKRAVSNQDGKFEFLDLHAGTFQLSVQMLGYSFFEQSIILKDNSINLRVSLSLKLIRLKEVTIGKNKDEWRRNFALFKEQFLGFSCGNDCVILNPEVIDFSTKNTFWDRVILTAEADDFLNIENRYLGYRIKYLLKAFTYNAFTKITSYDGNVSFEELEGTGDEKKIWIKNRQDAYQGSLMDFLRTVFKGKSAILNSGFVIRQYIIVKVAPGKFDAYVKPVQLDSIAVKVDSSFIDMKFKPLYIIYDPKQAGFDKIITNNEPEKIDSLAETGSVLSLYLDKAVVDERGSFADYRTFLIRGYWGRKRLGDQLPFEYQPSPQ